MTKKTREELNKMIRNNLKWMEAHIVNSIKMKNEHMETIQKLKANSNPDFSQQYYEKKIAEEKAAFRANLEQARDKARGQLEELRILLEERDTQGLDLGNEKLRTALTVLQTGGQTLTYEDVQDLAINFREDQKALRTLRNVGRNLGIHVKPFERLIFDSSKMIESLDSHIRGAYEVDSTFNRLAGKLAEFGKFEGVEINSLPDEVGLMNKTRIAAGLPVAEV